MRAEHSSATASGEAATNRCGEIGIATASQPTGCSDKRTDSFTSTIGLAMTRSRWATYLDTDSASMLALAGDFNGDGCDTVGLYQQSTGRFFVSNELGADFEVLEHEFSYYFGDPGDKPYAGDFDGDGVDTLGLHRESTGFVYFRDTHTQGFADSEFFYGIPDDRLASGDFDGDGTDTLVVFRPSEQKLYFRNSNTLGVADVEFQFGYDHWIPVS